MTRVDIRPVIVGLLVLLATGTALAQRGGNRGRLPFSQAPVIQSSNPRYDGRFMFNRLKYTVGNGGYYYRGLPSWAHVILPPETDDGLGIAILNSNAETHFSFTNALGLVSLEQTHRFERAAAHFPRARWIVALHHHVVEYPMPVKAFSERIGTALINGSWFVRRLEALADRAVVMHGHRHIDWIGACGPLKIISAPSPVMGATDDATTLVGALGT